MLWLLPSLSLLLTADPPPTTCASVEEFTRTLPTGTVVAQQAEGDLDGDGREDCAVLVERRDERDTWRQLYVLTRTAQGGLKVASKSREGQLGDRGNYWTEDVQIRNGSLYVQNNTKDGYVGWYIVHHQFKLFHGVWRLVGVEVSRIPTGEGRERSESCNLLTGDVLWTTRDGGQQRVRRSKRKVPPLLLADYDFDGPAVNAACPGLDD